MRDTEYGLGGHCSFFWSTTCDGVTSPTYPDPTGAVDAGLKHFILTDAQFDTYLDNVTITTDGFEYYEGL